jgi:hypothetical protein
VEVLVNDLLFGSMLGGPSMVALEKVDVILPLTCINPHVKKFSVSIRFFDICNACTLLFFLLFQQQRGAMTFLLRRVLRSNSCGEIVLFS